MKVKKSLSQEEMTLVSNIETLLGELKSANNAAVEQGLDRDGAPVIEKPEQISTKTKEGDGKDGKEVDGKEHEEPDGDEEVRKEITNTPSDVATARDDPEDRMLDALSEVDVENVDEVKKAALMIKKFQKQQANKSVDISPLARAMVDLTKVMKSINDRQNQTDTALGHILGAYGITSEMEKAEKAAKPIVDNDNANLGNFLTQLASTIQKSQGGEKIGTDDSSKPTAFGNTSKILKNLDGVLTGLGSMMPKKGFVRKNQQDR